MLVASVLCYASAMGKKRWKNQPAQQALHTAARYLRVPLTKKTPFCLLEIKNPSQTAGWLNLIRLWVVQVGNQPGICYVAQVRSAGSDIYIVA